MRDPPTSGFILNAFEPNQSDLHDLLFLRIKLPKSSAVSVMGPWLPDQDGGRTLWPQFVTSAAKDRLR